MPPTLDPDQWQLFLEIQRRQMVALEKLVDVAERLVPASTAAPNLTAPLETFSAFDWDSIGATVHRVDQYGAAIVSWRGLQFVRRSPSNKYQEIIFFSRCVGKDDDGNNKYERLISFKPMTRIDVEPVPPKVSRIVNRSDF